MAVSDMAEGLFYFPFLSRKRELQLLKQFLHQIIVLDKHFIAFELGW